MVMHCKFLGVVILLLAMINTGCNDENPDTATESPLELNSTKEGLVQVSETSHSHVTVKYLSPEYLAKAERASQEKMTNLSVDSMITAYSKTMSFQIHAVHKDASTKQIGASDHGGEYNELSADNMFPIEDEKELFRLESNDTVWYPILAQRESHVYPEGQTWFVVFPVQPDEDLKRNDILSIIYVSSDSDESPIRLFYNTNEFVD